MPALKRTLRTSLLTLALAALALLAAIPGATVSDTYDAGAYGTVSFHPFTLVSSGCVQWTEPGEGTTYNCDPINVIFPGRTWQQVRDLLIGKGWTTSGFGSNQSLHFADPAVRVTQNVQVFLAQSSSERYHGRIWQGPGPVTVLAVHHEEGLFSHTIDMAWDDAEAFVRNELCPSCLTELLEEQQRMQSGGTSWRGWQNDARATVIPPAVDNTAPTVSFVSPAESATGVPASANVSVTFSEPMDQAATQGAFSLLPAGGGAVSGSFSWSGQMMTFDPSGNLAAGAQYTATVSTAAKDLAGNALAGQKQWSFTSASAPPPATETTAYPSSTTIESGSLRSGDASRLAADDNAYYEVNSTTSGWTRVASLYGTFTGVSNSLTSLKASYAVKASASCSGTASIWRFTTSSWVQLDSRSLSTSEVLVQNLVPSGTLADYVSGTSGEGDVRIRIRCTKSFSSFYLSADLVKLVSAAP
jgi:Bacterial Ig-like domain